MPDYLGENMNGSNVLFGMSEPKNSNRFLDNTFSDALDVAEASFRALERFLTDKTKGDSSDGVNPNAVDVLDQLRGANVDRFRVLCDKVQKLRQATDSDLDEVRRIRVAQGYKP